MNINHIRHSWLFEHFWTVAGAASVRVKVLGIVLGVILLLSLFITIQMRIVLRDTLLRELVKQGMTLVDETAAQVESILAEERPDILQVMLQEKKVHYSGGSHNTRISYFLVQDISGEVISHTFEGAFPAELLTSYPAGPIVSPVVRDIQTGTEMNLDISLSLPHSDNLILRLGLSEANIQEVVYVVTWQIVSITLIMIAVGFAAAFFLTWILTRPILSLVEATQAVAKGDFSRQVSRWANDEIGDLAEAFNTMTRSLAEADEQRQERETLRENYIRGVIQAQEEERKRIARELHDSTSQSLTSLLVSLRNLEGIHDPEVLTARLSELRQVASGTLDEVHTLAWQLRPSVLDDLGLSVALQRYIADYEHRYSIPVGFVARGLKDRLPPAMEASIYRIVQEGLTNIIRHSNARNASVLLEQRQNSIRVIVEDDGVGFDPAVLKSSDRSFGLQGIRERAQLFGGQLIIESQPGQGSSLFIEIPLHNHE